MTLNASVFSTTNVTMTDLVVEGCLFVVSGALESVIGFEKCDSEQDIGTVRLHRIGFRENRFLGGAVAIQANALSCSKLEIEDFDFQRNICNGVCGLLLSKENRLQNITIRQNRRISSLNGVNDLLLTEENGLQNLSVEHYRSIPSLSSRSAIIWAPPRSSTSADNISALENSCTIFEVEGGSFDLSSSNFTKNSASGEEDDSISACIKMKDTSAFIRDCSFEENEASYGVAINARISNATLTNCTFQSNKAGMNGAICLRNKSSLTIDSCRFLSNRAKKSGGAIYSVDSHVIAYELTADGNRANRGGGGSVSITSESNLTVHNSVFKNGASLRGGAVEQSENSVGRFFNVTFVNNLVDEEGCAIFANNATLIIRNARFRGFGSGTGPYDEYSGGFLSATHHSSVLVTYTTMTNGSAELGGAIYLNDSILKAKDLNVSNCTASLSGGAVEAEDSEFLCTNCLLVSNKALLGSGGAISIARYGRRRSVMQIQESRIINNSAEFGGESTKTCTNGASLLVCFVGGLYLDEVYYPRSLENGYECTAAAIIDTQFEGNNATHAGGAIFANCLENTRFQCNSSSENANLTFLGEKDLSSLNRITPDTALCPTWKNNSAGIYGQVVGTLATMAKMTVEYKGEKTEVLTGEGFEIPDYVGGNQLPRLSVELLDELKQGPATIDFFNQRIIAELSTSEGFQVGSSSLSVEGQTAKFPHVIGFGLPGIYNMTIRFADSYSFREQFHKTDFEDADKREVIDSFTIIVHVRDCTIGEVPVGETKICNNCSSSTYNFDPEGEECQPCPENGNCTTRVVIPNDGYWLASPCSVNITRCLTSYACKFDDRVERLTNLTRDMKSCDINETTIEKYQQEQCAEASD